MHDLFTSFLDSVESIPLTGRGPTLVVIAVFIGVVGVVIASGWHRPRRLLAIAAAAAAVTVVVWVVLTKIWKPFPDELPVAIYVAGGIAIVSWIAVFALPRRRAAADGRGTNRWLLVANAAIATMAAGATANLIFEQFPDIRAFDPRPVAVPMSYADFQHTTEAPELDGSPAGALVSVDLESPASGFAHRGAIAYVPPAYFTQPQREFPVVVLLPGQPGSPEQWVTGGGQMAQTVDSFQRNHAGVSPIVVSVDGTGSATNNPICVDGPVDKVQTYLTADVPAQLTSKFRVTANQHSWTIGGLSYGGTCALQVVTNHPDAYGTFLDFSGQAEPTIGTRQATVDRFFGGDNTAFEAENPATLLQREIADKTGKYRELAGRFVAGTRDSHATQALTHLNELATEAGMSTSYTEVPGGHSFAVWRRGLQDNLAFAAERGGIQ